MAAPRRHRWITMPSGLLLFACVCLPGYRECGRSWSMADDSITVSLCGFGLVAAIASIAIPRRRWERWFAIGFTAAALIVALLLTVGWIDSSRVYAGLTLATVAGFSCAAGALVWEREAAGRPDAAMRRLRVLLPLVIAAWAATAALSTWHPPPDDHPSYMYFH